MPTTLRNITYGSGQISVGIFSMVPSLLLLYYMTEVLGIGPSQAGLVIFLPKTIILLTDPVIGYCLDRFKSRFRNWARPMLIGAIVSSGAFILLFTVTHWFSVTMLPTGLIFLCFSASVSLFTIPYYALPVELTSHENERTGLMAYRMGFGLFGVLIAGGAAPMLIASQPDVASGYRLMAMVLGPIALTAMLAPLASMGAMPGRKALGGTRSFGSAVRIVGADRGFVALATAFAFQMTAVGSVTALIPYYTSIRLGAPASAIMTISITACIVGMAAMPPWARIAKRVGLEICFASGAIIYGTGLCFFWLLPPSAFGAQSVLVLVSALVGIGTAGVNIAGATLLPNVMDAGVARDMPKPQAIYTGIWSSLEKGGLAAGAMLSGFALDLVGFSPHVTEAARSNGALGNNIAAVFALLPSALFVLSLAPIIFLRIHRNRQAKSALATLAAAMIAVDHG